VSVAGCSVYTQALVPEGWKDSNNPIYNTRFYALKDMNARIAQIVSDLESIKEEMKAGKSPSGIMGALLDMALKFLPVEGKPLLKMAMAGLSLILDGEVSGIGELFNGSGDAMDKVVALAEKADSFSQFIPKSVLAENSPVRKALIAMAPGMILKEGKNAEYTNATVKVIWRPVSRNEGSLNGECILCVFGEGGMAFLVVGFEDGEYRSHKVAYSPRVFPENDSSIGDLTPLLDAPLVVDHLANIVINEPGLSESIYRGETYDSFVATRRKFGVLDSELRNGITFDRMADATEFVKNSRKPNWFSNAATTQVINLLSSQAEEVGFSAADRALLHL
jgi:hypothetical protein